MPRSHSVKTRLDRSAVIRAAADLVNAEGIEALTINRLAQVLGIQPPSIYNHIDGLADLRRELALLSVNDLGDRFIQAGIGKSGPAGIRALAQAYRTYIKEYPGLYQASLRSSGKQDLPDPRLIAAEERAVRVGLAMVESFGLTGEDAFHAVRAFRSVVHGFATLEIAGGFGMPMDLDVSFNRLVNILIRGLEKTSGN